MLNVKNRLIVIESTHLDCIKAGGDADFLKEVKCLVISDIISDMHSQFLRMLKSYDGDLDQVENKFNLLMTTAKEFVSDIEETSKTLEGMESIINHLKY